MSRIKIELPENYISKFKIPVRITDINYGNHVGNDSIIAIIHEARAQFLELYNFTELSVAGTSLIMSDIAVEFKNEAFYKDIIEVKLFADNLSRVAFELYYSLSALRKNEIILIANAKTGMVCFNYKEKKVESVPDKLKKILLA